jgi:hypothetical protein
MLRSLNELGGYTVRASNGEIGQVVDFFFDDLEWVIHYLVVDTGNWLARHPVLLSVEALGQPSWAKKAFPVLLTKEQVEKSPGVASDRPVSHQMELELPTYYDWAPYWRPGTPTVGLGAAAAAQLLAQAATKEEEENTTTDPDLRSSEEVIQYRVQASDGKVGKVIDFIVDDESWRLCYVVIDTGTWLSGRQVLIPPTWAEEVDWAARTIHLELNREMIKRSPEYDPTAPVNKEHELRLYDYYGRPQYRIRL